DTGSSPSTSDSSSSRVGPVSSAEVITNDSVYVTISATVSGPTHQYLAINASATMNDDDSVFSRVDLLVGGKKIAGNSNQPSFEYNDVYEFEGEEFCDGNTYQVVIDAYRNNIKTASDNKTFTRNMNLCKPPSSASAPSSSAAAKQFVKIMDNVTLNSQTGDRGIALVSSAGESNINLADFYYDSPTTSNPGFIKSEKSSVRFITEFMITGVTDWNTIGTASNDPPWGITSPQSTSAFTFRVSNSGETEIQYPSDTYIMVRTNGASGGEWTSNDYLVATYGAPTMVGNNRTIKVSVWKIQ
ncbi:MAG: hypothetical protein FWC26_01525, partial [Fibromonadales bacterium]|nr:hypothetical protein [Fibromonadales bacterium]